MPLSGGPAQDDARTNGDALAAEYPSPAYGWYVVVVLTIAYVFSFIDRQILALLVGPIRQDLGISDTEVSLLMGLAFAIFYTLLGLPIGRMADRYSRRAIIAWGVTIWCCMTAACGLARNFGQLFLARIGVGVGEAALSPSALSLISDYFPRESRARALTFYNMGISVGSGIANIFGGMMIAFVSAAPAVVLPIVGEMRPWQTVFVIVGLPGLLVALLMQTVREPVRRDRLNPSGGRAGAVDVISVADALKFLRQRWQTYLTHFLSMSVVTIIGYGFFFWLPTMFVRTWQWTIPQISLAYGLITLIGGPVSILFSGWLADRLYRRGIRDGLMRISLGAAILFVPTSFLVPLMPSPVAALAMLVPATFGGAVTTAAGASALMMITPNQLRAQTSALYYFVINLLGLTLGASSVAMITNFVFADDAALRYSMSIVSIVSGTVAIGFLFAHLKLYRARVVEAESWSDG